MTTKRFVSFAGAGGGRVDAKTFGEPAGFETVFLPVDLPDWRWHLRQPRAPEDLTNMLCGQVIRLVPHGPVHLIGISLGGHLAFEVARSLQAAGRRVAGLCVIDSFFGGPPVPPAERLRRELRRASEEGRLAAYLTMLAMRRGLAPWERLRRGAWAQHARVGSNPWDLPAHSRSEYELSMRLLIELSSHLPTLRGSDLKPLDSPVLLLRTADNVADDEAWRQRCRSLRIAELPGSHHTLESATTVAAIRRLLEQGIAEWDGPRR